MVEFIKKYVEYSLAQFIVLIISSHYGFLNYINKLIKSTNNDRIIR